MRHRGDSDDNICSGENLVVSSREEEDSCWSKEKERESTLFRISHSALSTFCRVTTSDKKWAIEKDGSQDPESKRPRHDDDDRNARRSGFRLGLRDALICGGAKALASSPAARETMQ